MTQEQIVSLGWQLAGWLALAVLPIGIKWLYARSQQAVTDKHSATLKLLEQVAVTAVTYAEQAFGSNPDRKSAALRFVDSYLKSHNINLPVFEIEAAIESAVHTATQHESQSARP